MPSMLIGTLIQNTDCQPQCSIKKPPTAGPAKNPAATMAPIPPKARPRSLPRKALAIMAWQLEIMALEPKPCTRRAKIIQLKLCEKVASSEPIPKNKKPARYIYLRLYMSESLPKTGKKQVVVSK